MWGDIIPILQTEVSDFSFVVGTCDCVVELMKTRALIYDSRPLHNWNSQVAAVGTHLYLSCVTYC